ncbi:MAG: ribonuclease H-like domain-containing protein [Candidatus Omnitrophica bacterium]|nr:ribonuclease H-like domain-containing protein [Candidatus Omnitrophota bacterium]
MPRRNIVVLDLETQKSFKEVGKNKLDKLKISVAGIYDYLNGAYAIFEEKEILNLEKRIRDAQLLVGFNIKRFDLPVLAPYLFKPVTELPVLDLLEEIEKVRGHRVSLESIAKPTLDEKKMGSGTEALLLYQENRIAELKEYCLQDVRLTKEIYDYGCKYGKIAFTSSWDYKTYEIPVTWKETTEKLIQENPASEETFPSSLF